MSIPTVKCPNCGKPVAWTADSPFRPFCCERCKLIDLGEWASETRVIKGAPLTEQDLEDLEEELGQLLEDTDRKLH